MPLKLFGCVGGSPILIETERKTSCFLHLRGHFSDLKEIKIQNCYMRLL